jgi:hypothetical protein
MAETADTLNEETSREIAWRPKQARNERIPGSGHLVVQEKPEELGEAMWRFLGAVVGGQSFEGGVTLEGGIEVRQWSTVGQSCEVQGRLTCNLGKVQRGAFVKRLPRGGIADLQGMLKRVETNIMH